MIPNVTRGGKIIGLMIYLQGPGRANEHEHPRVVAGHASVRWQAPAGELDRDTAVALARAIDMPRQAFGTVVQRTNRKAANAAIEHGAPANVAVQDATSDVNVWHCSLSLSPEEAPLSDEKWDVIATELMKEMGFDDPDDPRSPARWVAVRHGFSTGGGDHIHIAASAVREDGTKVNTFDFGRGNARGDWNRAQEVCAELERRHGLRITEGRAAKITERGEKPAQVEAAVRRGEPETTRAMLARRVRGCATASKTEAEFIRRVRHDGMLIRPRYAKGSTTAVVGYSVALRPTTDKAADPARPPTPIWHGGGRLGVDLTLPRLREEWDSNDKSHARALDEWNRVRTGDVPGSLRSPKPGTTPEHLLGEARTELRRWDAYVRSIPADDRAGWARAAGQMAGVYAAWSARVEPQPGELAATGRALSKAAGIHNQARPAVRTPQPSAALVAMVAAVALTHHSPEASFLVLMRQLVATTKAIADAHTALGDANRAAEMVQHYRTLVGTYSGVEATARADGSLDQLETRLAVAAASPVGSSTTPRTPSVAEPNKRRPGIDRGRDTGRGR